MIEIGAFEAKNTFGGLLGRVERGEEIVITRRGKAVARITPFHEGRDVAAASAAAARLLETRKGVTLDGISLRELIETGRR